MEEILSDSPSLQQPQRQQTYQRGRSSSYAVAGGAASSVAAAAAGGHSLRSFDVDTEGAQQVGAAEAMGSSRSEEHRREAPSLPTLQRRGWELCKNGDNMLVFKCLLNKRQHQCGTLIFFNGYFNGSVTLSRLRECSPQ